MIDDRSSAILVSGDLHPTLQALMIFAIDDRTDKQPKPYLIDYILLGSLASQTIDQVPSGYQHSLFCESWYYGLLFVE
jgi:hypothetical protein